MERYKLMSRFKTGLRSKYVAWTFFHICYTKYFLLTYLLMSTQSVERHSSLNCYIESFESFSGLVNFFSLISG